MNSKQRRRKRRREWFALCARAGALLSPTLPAPRDPVTQREIEDFVDAEMAWTEFHAQQGWSS